MYPSYYGPVGTSGLLCKTFIFTYFTNAIRILERFHKVNENYELFDLKFAIHFVVCVHCQLPGNEDAARTCEFTDLYSG